MIFGLTTFCHFAESPEQSLLFFLSLKQGILFNSDIKSHSFSLVKTITFVHFTGTFFNVLHLQATDCHQLSPDLVVFPSLVCRPPVADGWFKQSDAHRQQTEGSVWKIASWNKYLCIVRRCSLFINFYLEKVLAWIDNMESTDGEVNVNVTKHVLLCL